MALFLSYRHARLQTNIGQNNNKFYVIQILVPESGGMYTCFQRWGRVGEPGQNMKRPFPTLDGAKAEFMKKASSRN